MANWGDEITTAVLQWAPGVVGAGLVLLIGWLGSGMLSRLVRRILTRESVDSTLIGFAANLTYMAALALVVITALGQLGVPTTSFAAVIGASALAVGFALQGSLANFAAGVMLMFFRPFKAGDFVEIGGVSGIVEEIQVFSTKIRTGDNREITVPNGQITSGAITNYSAKETRRIDLVFGIGYGDDLAKAKAILDRIVRSDERVLADPEPTIAVSELADSSVNFVVRPWVKSGDYWDVRSDLMERIKLEFDAQGVSIPFPQTDVHLHQVA